MLTTTTTKTTSKTKADTRIITIPPTRLKPNLFSLSLYGDPRQNCDDLRASIQEKGVLVPLVVTPQPDGQSFEILSGHRRHACALDLQLPNVPCLITQITQGFARQQAIIDYNLQRHKKFSELMREADSLEQIWGHEALTRKQQALSSTRRTKTLPHQPDRRNSDTPESAEPGSSRARSRYQPDHRTSDAPEPDPATSTSSDIDAQPEKSPAFPTPSGRTDVRIAAHLGLGGKDLYRQARAVWRCAQQGDARALAAVQQLDAGRKTIYAAYKDLRRRDRFTTGFKPTPYDVWAFRSDPAFGIPHPGAIPASIVANAIHYFSNPGDLVVDPMAGGGTVLDVAVSMGRRCLAYDLKPSRPEIQPLDIRLGFPTEAHNCDLIFCDPPYHTMLAKEYGEGVSSLPLTEWLNFLEQLTKNAFDTLKPGGVLALVLAPQSEKDLPAGIGYLDHPLFGLVTAIQAGFTPQRRISCPMSGHYTPQQVHNARTQGQLLGQVRDLLILKRQENPRSTIWNHLLFSAKA